MSENQRKILIDFSNMITLLDIDEVMDITKYAENIIDMKLLSLEPTILLRNMDITEKIMLLKELSKSEEQKREEDKDAISIEDFINEMGLADEVHN